MTEWQPIETAPEKTPILLFVPKARNDKSHMQVGWYGLDGSQKPMWIIGNMFGFDVGQATHWMPLPEPPKP